MPGFMIETGDGPNNMTETERVHRWRITLPGAGSVTPWTDFAVSCSRPMPIIDKVTYHQGQNEIYVPGKHRWEPIRATFYVVQEMTLQKIKEWRDKVVDMAESAMNNKLWQNLYKNEDVTLEALDGQGQPIWTYTLKGAWPERIEPNRFDHASSELATVEVTISYDFAKEE